MPDPASPLSLLLVDDHRLVIDGLRAMLSTDRGIGRVETAGSLREALDACAARLPHVVLLDLRLPGDDGFSILDSLLGRWPALRVLILSGTATRADIALARRSGASGFLDKSVQRAELLRVIRTVAAGGTHFPAAAPAATAGPALTARELEVLQHLTRGLHNDELATALGVGIETIKTHLRTIFGKLDVASRTEAVARAHELGLLGV